MEGDGFDPCECLWNHNMAMRRLLSLLRQSQAYCTDTECLNELPGSDFNTESNFYFIAFCWFLFAMLMYFLRPSTFRRQGDDVLKVRNNQNGSSDNSSNPPPLC